MKYILICLGLICLFLCICVVVEQYRLVIRKEVLRPSSFPSAFEGYKILQISDLHRRSIHTEKILHRIEETHLNCIVITGDSVSKHMTDFTALGEFLQDLQKIAPVYVSVGNHELELPKEIYQNWKQTIQNHNCILLENTTVTLEHNHEKINLVGDNLRYDMFRDEHYSFRNLQPYTIEKMQEDIGTKQGFTILLAHNPLPLSVYAQWGAEVILSGHVHGGVIRLPFLGGILSPERKFFPKYSKGLYSSQNTCMEVSAGVGKLRLFNPAELVLIELKSK